MTSPEKSAAISSSCPSCGAGMEVDNDAGVMRCPYCQQEVLLPKSQDSMPSWPSAEQFGSGFTTTVTVNGSRVSALTPEQAAKARRGQKIMALVFGIGMVLLFIFVFVPMFTSLSSSSSSGAKVKEVALGETAKVTSYDTTFEAVVHKVDCTKTSITEPEDPATSYKETGVQKAEGKFCVVSLSVKNVGEKTGRYDTFDLKATNATERDLERNSTAEGYLNNGAHLLSELIDPGKIVNEFLVFDVPTDTTIAHLQLSEDYPDSVKVKVS